MRSKLAAVSLLSLTIVLFVAVGMAVAGFVDGVYFEPTAYELFRAWRSEPLLTHGVAAAAVCVTAAITRLALRRRNRSATVWLTAAAIVVSSGVLYTGLREKSARSHALTYERGVAASFRAPRSFGPVAVGVIREDGEGPWYPEPPLLTETWRVRASYRESCAAVLAAFRRWPPAADVAPTIDTPEEWAPYVDDTGQACGYAGVVSGWDVGLTVDVRPTDPTGFYSSRGNPDDLIPPGISVVEMQLENALP